MLSHYVILKIRIIIFNTRLAPRQYQFARSHAKNKGATPILNVATSYGPLVGHLLVAQLQVGLSLGTRLLVIFYLW